MKIKSIVTFVILVGFLVIISKALFADGVVKLSTYYPAPFGAYDRIKLVPRESLPLEPDCDGENDLGTMYYDKGAGLLPEGVYVCQKISMDSMIWVPMTARYY